MKTKEELQEELDDLSSQLAANHAKLSAIGVFTEANVKLRDELAALRTQNAALLAVVKEALQNCSIDNHAGADDFMCHFCNKARVVLAAAKGE